MKLIANGRVLSPFLKTAMLLFQFREVSVVNFFFFSFSVHNCLLIINRKSIKILKQCIFILDFIYIQDMDKMLMEMKQDRNKKVRYTRVLIIISILKTKLTHTIHILITNFNVLIFPISNVTIPLFESAFFL